MKEKNKDLRIINLTVKSNNINDRSFLLSNISFSLYKNQTIGIYFKNQEEKESFISVFTNKNERYSGILNLNNKIFSCTSTPISKISSFYKTDIFNEVEDKTRIIEVVEKKIFNSQYEKIIETIRQNNKFEKHIKMLKIFKYKKIEYAYIKAINKHNLKSIEELKLLIDKFKNGIKNNEDIKDYYDAFIIFHSKYLKGRIKLLVERNIAFVDLYLNNLGFNIYKEELVDKSKELIKKIDKFKVNEKSLSRYKRNFQNTFDFYEQYKKQTTLDFKFQRNTINAFIWEMQYKINVYKEAILKYKKNEEKYWIFNNRILIFKELISILRKESKNFDHLNYEQSISFFNNIHKIYKNILIKQEASIDDKNKLSRRNLKSYINEELAYILTEYKNISELTKTEIDIKTNQLKTEREEFKKTVHITKINKLKLECQDLVDEIEWEKKSIFYNLNDNIQEITSEMSKETQEYRKIKIEYNSLLSKFLETKNKFLAKKHKKPIENIDLLGDEVFAKESLKFEVIYNFVQSDSKKIERLFTKQVNISKNSKMLEVGSISRYIMLKTCRKFNLSIFDFLKRIGKIDQTTRSIILLLIAYLDGKNVVILENIFSKVSGLSLEKLTQVYKNITNDSNKNWILIEENLSNAKNAIDLVSIIDNSKQIEHSIVNEIVNNPVYQTTINAFGIEYINNTKNRKTPSEFLNINDYNYNYDYYKLENHHYVFGNPEQIYEWTGKIVKESSKTISTEALKNFENKIFFDKLYNSTSKHKSSQINANSNDFESKEYLIVDVK